MSSERGERDRTEQPEIRIIPKGEGRYQVRVGNGSIPELMDADTVLEQVALRLRTQPPTMPGLEHTNMQVEVFTKDIGPAENGKVSVRYGTGSEWSIEWELGIVVGLTVGPRSYTLDITKLVGEETP